MAQIRHDLHQDVASVVSGVSGVVDEVQEVMDWRSIVRNHPFIATGLAFTAGYLIAPRRAKHPVRSPNHPLGAQNPQVGLPKKPVRPIPSGLQKVGAARPPANQTLYVGRSENP